MRRQWNLVDAGATQALGRRLGESAPSGGVLALSGDLGAGKTCLAQGFGAGLGVQGPITSPTFTLVWVHESGRLPFAHADFYRLGDGSELQELGLDELLEGDGVAVIEWADRFKEALPADRLSGSLAHAGPDTRTLELIATGPRSRAWLQALD
jgi:tRNA threonylcarbamoyladenosine biosynthesis protein TsaE